MSFGAIASGLPLAQSSDFFRDRSESGCIQENRICPGWVIDNFDRYVSPTLEHIVLVTSSVAIGFVLAFAMAAISYRRRWLVPPFTALTGILYTIPSLAFFFLLLPITGFGTDTAIIALSAYNLQIIYRNIVVGLANVPESSKDAGRGMGMTDRQLFWQVEVPLAVPETVAGLRIAMVSTVAIASLAFFAGGGGLGEEIASGSNITFKTGVLTASAILIAMAILFDMLLVAAQRQLVPWRKVRVA
jgi:osmoprotectant transport system permease protein